MKNGANLCVCARTPHTPQRERLSVPLCVRKGRAHTDGRETFVVTLREMAHPVPVDVRLRRFLKEAGRRFGLKCTAVANGETVADERHPDRHPTADTEVNQ